MKKTLLYLILIMSIIMAGTVAYVSVGGLLKVFSGAGTLGLILFSSIEIAKIIATSAIHTYGKILGWFYNTLLSLGILIAMVITSMGIYGFLSSTYKESFSKMESVESRLELIETKSNSYKIQLTSLNDEKESINNTISELSKGLSNNVIQYRDKETNQIITTTSSSTRRALEKQLDRAVSRQTELNTKIDELSNIVFDLDNEALEVKLGNDVASELGPLKYLAEVTGTDMDNVMKWFILLLIVIGDPMAVLMVIVFNKVANIKRVEKPDIEEDDVETKEVEESEEEEETKEDEIESEKELPELIEDEHIDIEVDEILEEEEEEIEDIIEEDDVPEEVYELDNIDEEIEEDDIDIEESEDEKVMVSIEEDDVDVIKEEIMVKKEGIKEEMEGIMGEKEEIEDVIVYSLKENSEIDQDLLEKLDKLKRLEEKEKELKEREDIINRLDDEIKDWENTHWKLRRNKKPPSAIE